MLSCYRECWIRQIVTDACKLLTFIFASPTSEVMKMHRVKCAFPVAVVVACFLCGFHVGRVKQVTKRFTRQKTEVWDRVSHSPLALPTRWTAAPTSPTTRLSDCTVEDVRKRPGVIVLTTTNTGFLDILLNLLESIKRTGVCPNVTIIAEDPQAYAFLLGISSGQPGLNVLKTSSGFMTPQKLMFGTKVYKELVNKRAEYLLSFLEKGLEVMFTDTDTFWFRDPFPYFQGDFDVAMLDELLNYPERNPTSRFCAGLAYFKPTERTLRFVREWVRRMKGDKKKKRTPDQDVMNNMLLHDQPVHMEVRSLKPSFFPKGKLFYNNKWRRVNNNTAVMHSSMILGHDKKVTYYKEHNMWLPIASNFSNKL